ncbi:MAG: hypothetical protein KatS3mg090_0283 [Patescibacteria group bacterium]|nr:MAG: hypothetical protein KatS3mg090_0283 [Patescibacteria group bacterium]
MLSPKKEKYRRRFRPKTRRVAIKADRLSFGKLWYQGNVI